MLAALTLALLTMVPGASAHYGAGVHVTSTYVLQDECGYETLEALFGSFNCVRVEGTVSTFTCTDSGSGTSKVRSCGSADFTLTVTAYNWINPGSFSATLEGYSWGCHSPSTVTDADAAGWDGDLLSPSLAVQRTLGVTCGAFSYGWGECAGHSALYDVDYFGNDKPSNSWGYIGHFLECIPYP